MSVEAEILKRLACFIRPGPQLEIKRGKGLSEEISGRFALGLKHGSIVGDPKTLFALPGGSSLQAQQIYLIGELIRLLMRPLAFLR